MKYTDQQIFEIEKILANNEEMAIHRIDYGVIFFSLAMFITVQLTFFLIPFALILLSNGIVYILYNQKINVTLVDKLNNIAKYLTYTSYFLTILNLIYIFYAFK